jgi:hypothetical protein
MARLMARALAVLSLVFAVLAAAASAANYREADVHRAFSSVKIRLATTQSGNESQSVTALTAVVRTNLSHTAPYGVAVWVYPSEALATQAFRAGSPQWRSNGIATTQLRNLVVIAVPKGREIGTQGPMFRMPLLVRRALAALKR